MIIMHVWYKGGYAQSKEQSQWEHCTTALFLEGGTTELHSCIEVSHASNSNGLSVDSAVDSRNSTADFAKSANEFI